jgi:hypothetical protein
MIIEDKINKLTDYHQTISRISQDSVKNPLFVSEKILFNYEEFSRNVCPDAKCVDAIAIRPNKKNGGFYLVLLEFKGGKDPDEWDEYCLEFKGLDTLHCGFPKLLDENRSAWIELFQTDCQIWYFIICHNENILFTPSSSSLEILHRRQETQKMRTKMDQIMNKLKRYQNGHPFHQIEIIPTKKFSDKYLCFI